MGTSAGARKRWQQSPLLHITEGQPFGRWVVITPRAPGKLRYATCQCMCGAIEAVRRDRLVSGVSTRCQKCTEDDKFLQFIAAMNCKVDRDPGRSWNGTPCHQWTGPTIPDGYGIVSYASERILAHRFFWMLKHGRIPGGVQILHHCDWPPCVNVAHLFEGDHDANMKDKAAKNRAPYGERHSCARLTDEQVNEIRSLIRIGSRRFGCRALARRYGVDSKTISSIVAGKHRLKS